jgi:predicted RNA-binding protein with PIN domain
MMKALIVDGYNAIHKIPRLRGIMDKNLLKARQEITRLALEYKRKRGGVDKVYVVFDGRDIYETMSFNRGNQVFSKTGKGDETIVRLINRLSGDYRVEVVSDDNYVRNNARAHKARVMGVSEFASLIKKRERNVAGEVSEERITPRNTSKINKELRAYWNI